MLYQQQPWNSATKHNKRRLKLQQIVAKSVFPAPLTLLSSAKHGYRWLVHPRASRTGVHQPPPPR